MVTGSSGNPHMSPDLILLGGAVITQWPSLPRAEALAIRDGLIVAVGSNREMLGLAGPDSAIVGCQGRCVVPGFHDAHLHLLACASKKLSVDCSPSAVGNVHEIQEAIKERARSVPPGTWIRAGDYDEFKLAERRHPTRWELDAAAPDHPVKLQHRSLHACVLNSLALRLAGLDADTPAIAGALIDVDPLTKEPTGLLYGYGEYLSAYVIPPLNEADLRFSLKQVLNDLLANGITSVHDATYRNGLPEWERLRAICAEDGIRPRIGLMVGRPHLEQFVERGIGYGFGDEWLRVGAVKFMLTEGAGDFHPSAAELTEQLRLAHQSGFQVAIHAVDESAVCVAAEALAAVMQERGSRTHRIEHCSVSPPPLIDRLAELGVAVVTQPSFLFYSGDRYLADVEEHLQGWLYPIRSFLERGIVVGAGSDAPVAPARPLDGICAAATRLSSSGRVVAGGERITLEQALGLYTSGAAGACDEYGYKGSIQPGKLADLVVLSADLTAIEPRDIRAIEVEMTIVGGEVAWRKGSGGAS